MPQKKLKSRLKKSALIILGLYVFLGLGLYIFQEKILFLPEKLDQDYQFDFNSSFKEVFLESNDGAKLNAIHFKASNPKGAILYFHGNAGSLKRWGTIAEELVQYNYDVFVMDYRTYGKSTGKLSEKDLYSDAQLCYDYVLSHFKPKEIIIYGRSLGTGIASYIASRNEAQQLILETPFYSITDVAKHRFPIYPVESLLTYEIPTYKFLNNVHYPITVFHGTEDNIVPFASGLKLKSQFKNINLIKILGGNHHNLSKYKDYHRVLTNILE